MIFWLKAMGFIMVMFSCSACGIFKAAHFSQRIHALEQARKIALTIKQKLLFTLAPPKSLLEMLLYDEGEQAPDYLANSVAAFGSMDFEAAWDSAVSQSRLQFTDSDKKQLKEIGRLLGKSDIETQSAQLCLLIERLDASIEEARRECDTKQRLAISLGTLAGLFVMIILI